MCRNTAAISGIFHRFNTWSRARRQKVQHALPVIRRTKVQTKQILMSRLHSLLMCQPANLRGSAVIDREDPGIEAAHRAESRSERNLVHWQRRLVDQLLGKMQTARL